MPVKKPLVHELFDRIEVADRNPNPNSVIIGVSLRTTSDYEATHSFPVVSAQQLLSSFTTMQPWLLQLPDAHVLLACGTTKQNITVLSF